MRGEAGDHRERRAAAAACRVWRGWEGLVPGLLSLPLGSTNRSQPLEPEAM